MYSKFSVFVFSLSCTVCIRDDFSWISRADSLSRFYKCLFVPFHSPQSIPNFQHQVRIVIVIILVFLFSILSIFSILRHFSQNLKKVGHVLVWRSEIVMRMPLILFCDAGLTQSTFHHDYSSVCWLCTQASAPWYMKSRPAWPSTCMAPSCQDAAAPSPWPRCWCTAFWKQHHSVAQPFCRCDFRTPLWPNLSVDAISGPLCGPTFLSMRFQDHSGHSRSTLLALFWHSFGTLLAFF